MTDVTSKTWRSGGIDIRSGEDPSDGSTDPNPGSIIWNVTNSSGSSIGSPPVGGSTSIVNQNTQNTQNTLYTASTAANVFSGFGAGVGVLASKQSNLFGVEFMGFSGFPNVLSNYRNHELLEDQLTSISAVSRRVEAGWRPLTILFRDDSHSAIMNILNEQMNIQLAGQKFDVIISFYDTTGATTGTTQLVDCDVMEYSGDTLSSSSHQMHVLALIRPSHVIFS